MKALNIDRTNTIQEVKQPPTDQAYICEILDAVETEYTTQSGYNVHRLDVHFDITEGEFAGYYFNKMNNSSNEDEKWKGILKINIPKEDGSERDDWTIKSFNSNILAIEDSNPSYKFEWDEKSLIGKKVGLLFRKKEWCFNGKVGFYPEPFKFISIDDAKTGNFKEPKAKLLPEGTISTNSEAINNYSSFMNIEENSPEEVPF